MVFAIDYDGTIADTNGEKVKWIRANLPNLGRDVKPWECDRTSCVPIIGRDPYEEMSNYVYERPSTLQAAEVPGAAEALRVLCQAGDVYIVTARLPHRIAFAEEWLAARNLTACIRGILTSDGSKKEAVCRQIGAEVLIDDDARHLSDSSLGWLKRILLQNGRKDVPHCDTGITFCASWAEVLKCLGVARA